MVGATLASLLSASRPDWQIVLVEAKAFNADINAGYSSDFDARSTALAQGSVEILKQLGIWTRMQQHAAAIRQVHVSDRGHFAGSLLDAKLTGGEAVGYVVENTWINNVLTGHIQQRDNIAAFAPAWVESLNPLQRGAALGVRHADGKVTELTCKLAVIADGGDSQLGRSLGITTRLTDYQQTAIITNIGLDRAHQGIAYERFTEQGPLALLPIPPADGKDRAALVWTLPHAEAEHHLRMEDAAFLVSLQRSFGYRAGRFVRVGQRHAFPLQLLSAEEQVRGHTVLMGNAAHFLHPVAGQGFNLALRDCVCLVEALLEGEREGGCLGELSMLQNYLQRQQQDQWLTIQFSDRLVRLFSSARLPLLALRHLGFLGIGALPPAKSLFLAQAMGTAGRRSRWKDAAQS